MACARNAFRAWQGWCSMGTERWRGRERDKLPLPDLPQLQDGECPTCGSTESLAPERIYYKNVHGRFNTGLPDYFRLVIAEQPGPDLRRWGRPYSDDGIGRIPWPEMLENIAAFDEQQLADQARARFLAANFVGGGRNWDGTFGYSMEAPKTPPDPAIVAIGLEILKDRWPQIAGPELAAMTRPLGFTGRRKRKLLVWADTKTTPPWGSWTKLSIRLPERRKFTIFRNAVNAAIAPMQVDHIEFKTTVPARFL